MTVAETVVEYEPRGAVSVHLNRMKGPRRPLRTAPGHGDHLMRGALVAQRTCTVDGCDRDRVYRFYCEPHYRRWKRNGDPGAASFRKVGQGAPVCSFGGCGRPTRTAALCAAHYLQKFHGRDLIPLLERPDTTARDEHGRKPCTACGEWLPTSSFYSNPKTRDRLSSWCRGCQRHRALLKSYGISMDEYREMLAGQGGVCAICGGVNKDGRQLFVDHDHATGEVRGLLCNLCNRGIGNMRDSIELLQGAIEYLARVGLARE